MQNQHEQPAARIYGSSVFCLIAGLLSILLYLPLHIDYSSPVINRMLRSPIIRILRIPFVPSNGIWGTIANAIPLPIYLCGGIVLGIFGLWASSKVLQQIKVGNVRDRNRVMAITGKILSVLGIITNVLSLPIFLVQ